MTTLHDLRQQDAVTDLTHASARLLYAHLYPVLPSFVAAAVEDYFDALRRLDPVAAARLHEELASYEETNHDAA
jgi:hypothetical protein